MDAGRSATLSVTVTNQLQCYLGNLPF